MNQHLPPHGGKRPSTSRPATQSSRRAAPPAGRGYVSAGLTYRRRKTPVFTGTLIYAVLFLLVILICILVIVQTRSSGTPEDTRYVEITTAPEVMDSTPDSSTLGTDTTVPPETTAPPVNEDPGFIGPPTTIHKPKFETVTVQNSTVSTGNLILINYEHPYVFPESQPQTVLYGNKSKSYMLSRADISLNRDLFPIFDGMISDFAAATGCKEVLVTSGYRSYQFQQDLYNSRVASQGEELAAMYVAKAGYSEHHAGLAVDMVIFSGGQQYYFPEFEAASWIIENAASYGFFLRYTEEMSEITKCASEPWHYRYVGAPHARLITDLGISFEEYHSYLHQFRWDGNRLLIAEDGTVSETDGLDLPESGHMIYYVPAAEGEITEIPVPPEMIYEISGDNAGGFIITVMLR